MPTATPRKRVLAAKRISRKTDASTSIERQNEQIGGWASYKGYEIVASATDEDVSGKVPPWDRPELGKWLTDEACRSWDVLVATKFDRVSRSLIDFLRLVEWLDERGKGLVILEADGLDSTTKVGKLIIRILAIFAEFERETIRERVADSYRLAREEGRWHGGMLPAGYAPVRLDGGGWGVAIDEEFADVIRDIVRRVKAGESTNSIAWSLNEAGIPSPRDWQRKRAGEELRRDRWTVTGITKILRGRGILGEVTDAHGKPFRGPDGMPIVRAPALISHTEWAEVQRALDERGRTRRRTRQIAPYSGLLFCACGRPMYRWRVDGQAERYVCRTKGKRAHDGVRACANPSVVTAVVDAAVDSIVNEQIGDLPVMRRVFVPGEDYAEELEQVKRAIRTLRDDRDAGLFTSKDDEDDYRQRMAALVARRDKLAALPSRPGGWKEEPTGEFIRDAWSRLAEHNERRQFLLDHGYGFVVGPVVVEDGARYRVVSARRIAEDVDLAEVWVEL